MAILGVGTGAAVTGVVLLTRATATTASIALSFAPGCGATSACASSRASAAPATLRERLGPRAPRVLLVLPPLTQLNTPYPSTAYLAGFLRSEGLEVAQVDLGLELVLALFSSAGVEALFDEVVRRLDAGDALPEEVERALDHRTRYARTIEPVVRFLQGRDETLASRIASRRFLPEGPRFESLREGELADLGTLGVRDAARCVATRCLDDPTCPRRDRQRFAFTATPSTSPRRRRATTRSRTRSPRRPTSSTSSCSSASTPPCRRTRPTWSASACPSRASTARSAVGSAPPKPIRVSRAFSEAATPMELRG